MKQFQMRDILRDEAKEGGEGGNGAFDPVAFQAAITKTFTDFQAEQQKKLNSVDAKHANEVKGLKALIESLKPKEEPQQQQEEQRQQEQSTKGAPDLEKQAQQRRIEVLEKAVKDANLKVEEKEKASEQRDRFSEVRSKLAGMGLKGDAEMETAFRLFKDDVKRDESGNLIAGPDAEPFDKYMQRQITTVYNFLLPDKQVSGAGASRGNNTAAPGFDMNTIKAGMKPEDRARALAEIAKFADNAA